MKIIKRHIFLFQLVLLIFSSKAQTKDSIKYYDYYLILNAPVGRTFGWDIGAERIKPLTDKMRYAMQLSVRGGKRYMSRELDYYNPKFLSLCFQPFHLLIGKKLQFETGISFSLQLYRLNGKQYPVTDTINFYRDALAIIYSVGLRYTFNKPQLSLKLIFGPGYRFDLQSSNRYFLQNHTAEMGVSWRIREKIKHKLRAGKTIDLYDRKQ